MRAFRLAYDGRDYHGFQRQPDVPTVEDAVFDALRDLGAYSPRGDGGGSTTAANGRPDDNDHPADRPRGYAAAGRTDAGVSALAQTVAFDAPDWLTPRALNAELPAEIRAWASADAPEDFHATHDATERTYAYHLYAPTETDDRLRGGTRPARNRPVDDARVRDALAGTHDFHNLTPDADNTERTLSLDADRDGDHLVLAVSAGGFARQLVRRLVTLIRRVGTGEAPTTKVDRTLASEPLPGHEGIPPAPPEPLVLADVTYPGVDFAVDAEAAASARAAFERARVDRATGARVARQLRDGLE